MFEIHSNIPIPSRSSRSTKYPFAKMRPGDCFSIPVEGPDEAVRIIGAVRSSAHNFLKKNPGMKLTIRTLPSEGETSLVVRVWLTAKTPKR